MKDTTDAMTDKLNEMYKTKSMEERAQMSFSMLAT